MDNTILPQVENGTPKKSFNYKKGILISLLVVAVLTLGTYFFLKYKKTTVEAPKPVTQEEKIDILNNLQSPPPNDGSVSLTADEKLKILDTITTKKQDPKVKRTKLTAEEQQKMFGAIE